jgi:uncharacterized membrane protein
MPRRWIFRNLKENKSAHLTSVEDILDDAALDRIGLAIRQAESGTSGEIRVHVDDFCREDVLDHAAFLFSELGMHRTALRNGVLIYVAWNEHKLAIIGDAGVHAVTGPGFWDSTRDAMIRQLQAGDLAGAICEGVRLAGEQLSGHFPGQKGDVNELSDAVSFGSRRRNGA